MKKLFIDASNSGIAGDMFLAALLSIVKNREEIIEILKKLKEYLPSVTELKVSLVNKKQHDINTNFLKLSIKEDKAHRSAKKLKEVLNKFLDDNNFSLNAQKYANAVLNTLIKAESEVHNKLEDKIHLHELSSVDTLIDIVGVTKCLETLGAFKEGFKIYISEIPLGGGTIKGAHGLLPIPAPATVNILQKTNIQVKKGPIDSELITPTGAALLANLNLQPREMKSMRFNKVAYSTGKKSFKGFLNILQVFYEDTPEKYGKGEYLKKYTEKVTVLETNVDDVSGETIGDFITKMEQENILDVQVVQSITKKNRVGNIIKVLCDPKYEYEIIEKIIEELGTLGVRICRINRVCVDRELKQTELKLNGTKYGLNYKLSFIEFEGKKKIVNISQNTRISKKLVAKLDYQLINYGYWLKQSCQNS